MSEKRQQAEKKIQDIKEVLESLPEAFKADMRTQLIDAMAELDKIKKEEADAEMQAAQKPVPKEDEQSMPEPIQQPIQPPMQAAPESESPSMNVNAALASLAALMQSNEGSGVDDKRLRDMIELVLADTKIDMRKLDEEVVKFIKQNQTFVLELPQYGNLKIQVTKDDQDIPFFFDILDDVLAGNNVYLIGEAGGGKTYSAEMVAKKLKREISIINCSQYTSPTEIVGGQTITGYRDGKLIEAWREGKVLILDEMPRLDPNTAGLFNDALAKSSHTRKPQDALINSTNPQQPPIPRNNNFALIATGNIYPNDKPPSQYAANNRQDLSLLDRFSGSVYRIEYSKKLDENQARFQFLYDMLVGNYYEYMDAVKNNRSKPEAVGLRTVLKDLSYDNMAVVSYRTIVSFRVAFEFELVRELAKLSGTAVPTQSGKTLYKAFQSFLVAYSKTSVDTIISKTGFTEKYIENKVKQCVEDISKGQIVKTLVEPLAKKASDIYKRYEDLFAAETIEVKS